MFLPLLSIVLTIVTVYFSGLEVQMTGLLVMHYVFKRFIDLYCYSYEVAQDVQLALQ